MKAAPHRGADLRWLRSSPAELRFSAFFPLERFRHPYWFLALLLLSSITSAFKVNLPLARSGSTMSVSYAVDFLSLILLGPAQTMIVGAISAWSQCTFRMTTKNPPYRTLFSMASLVISVQAAGAAFHALGGIAGSGVDAARGDGQAAARRRRRVFPLQHGARRDRDCLVDPPERC